MFCLIGGFVSYGLWIAGGAIPVHAAFASHQALSDPYVLLRGVEKTILPFCHSVSLPVWWMIVFSRVDDYKAAKIQRGGAVGPFCRALRKSKGFSIVLQFFLSGGFPRRWRRGSYGEAEDSHDE
ncbi:MAG: hypothetical protein AB7U82_29830 [Blastocatellales bacterium]